MLSNCNDYNISILLCNIPSIANFVKILNIFCHLLSRPTAIMSNFILYIISFLPILFVLYAFASLNPSAFSFVWIVIHHVVSNKIQGVYINCHEQIWCEGHLNVPNQIFILCMFFSASTHFVWWY